MVNKNHWVKITLEDIPPAIALNKNPEEIQNKSNNGMFLSFKQYENWIIKYNRIIKNKVSEKLNAIKELMINNKNENKIASFMFILPDAIGLYFLIGWSLSSFISTESLSKYTELEVKQKHIRAKNDFINSSFSKLRPKIGAAKTNRFLVHWFGLQDMNIALIFFGKKFNIFQ